MQLVTWAITLRSYSTRSILCNAHDRFCRHHGHMLNSEHHAAVKKQDRNCREMSREGSFFWIFEKNMARSRASGSTNLMRLLTGWARLHQEIDGLKFRRNYRSKLAHYRYPGQRARFQRLKENRWRNLLSNSLWRSFAMNAMRITTMRILLATDASRFYKTQSSQSLTNHLFPGTRSQHVTNLTFWLHFAESFNCRKKHVLQFLLLYVNDSS